MWQHESEDQKRVICDLCPRHCAIAPGQRGFCFVRENRDGKIVSTTYGRSTGFCVDPIEKKPLHHFYPGTPALSFGTPGCNLGCTFCQNWTMSRNRNIEATCEDASPEAIAAAAVGAGCRSVAFTYNDPIVWAEYAIDTARACHALGVKTAAVTNGYITAEARPAFFEPIDAANVDLKGFTEHFYRTHCNGQLEPVLDTLRWLARESRVWVEITNLLIPRANDSIEEIAAMCHWIVKEMSPDVPLHFSAFHPDFKMMDRDPTPPEMLRTAYDIARKAGLHYVYVGNVYEPERQHTYCPGCGHSVIRRDGYSIAAFEIRGGRCVHCRTPIAGLFDDAPGTWGGRRMPVKIES
jgi:pyruvate formate lyase activating enzyme